MIWRSPGHFISPAPRRPGGLVIAVVVLGYLYYQERRDGVELKIDLPNLTIEKK